MIVWVNVILNRTVVDNNLYGTAVFIFRVKASCITSVDVI